jgi:hypothetical protein
MEDQHNVKSKYDKAFDETLRIVEGLEKEVGRQGHFSHILRNLGQALYVDNEEGAKSSEIRRGFRESLHTIRVYLRLLEEFPDFRKGELGKVGYFNKEGHPLMHDATGYVEDAEKDLRGHPKTDT